MKYHFIGIGGIGMSGLARLLLSQHQTVSGSDLVPSPLTQALKKEGAQIFIGHQSHHLSSDMVVIYSSGIKKENPEYQAACHYQCPMMHRSDLLVDLMRPCKGLVVTGTHGKTTTSSLLAWVLTKAGLDPSFCIGGILQQLQTNAWQGQGDYFVAESDESDGTFLKYDPFGAIVTNIDIDHMDYFGTEDRLIQSFRGFIQKVRSSDHLFFCGDDSRLSGLKVPGIRYGFGQGCDLQGTQYRQEGWRMHFDIDFQGRHYPCIDIPIVGMHNAYNALAVFGMALQLGIAEKVIREAFHSFNGVGRRCEKKGEFRQILFLDDYAHHPTAIAATLKGIREAISHRRLVAIFQPHRYTRTRDCLGSYKGIFEKVDKLVITDIYGAGEDPIEGITSQTISEEVLPTLKDRVCTIPREQIASTVTPTLRPGDVVITLGAGDTTTIAKEMMRHLGKHHDEAI